MKSEREATERPSFHLSQEAYRQLVEDSGSVILLSDPDLNITFMNPYGLAFFGYCAEELIGRNAIGSIIPGRDEEHDIVAMMDDLRRHPDQYSTNVHQNRRKDGSLVWMSWTNKAIYDDEGRLVEILAIGNDLTKLKLAEEALQRTETRYRMLHESLRDAFVQVAMDGRILDCNDQFCLMLGYSPEELRALTYQELTPERWHETEAGIVRDQILPRGYSDVYEKEYQRKDGAVIPVEMRTILSRDAENTPSAMWAIVRETTERKKAEQALRESERKFREANRVLRAHSRSDKILLHATDEATYLEDVCRIIVENCGYAMVWVGMAEEDEAKTIRPVAFAGFEEGYLETLRLTWADTDRGRGPTGTAIRTGSISTCRNMLTDPAFLPWRAEALKRGFASSIVLPLMKDGKAFGALTIYSREPDPFSEEEVALLKDLADDFAHGIDTVRLRASHAEAAEALSESRAKLKIAEATHAERQRLYDVLETLPAMICLLTPDHRIAFANRSFRERFGELNGRLCYEHRYGRTEPCTRCGTYRVFESGEPHHSEFTDARGSVFDAFDFPFTDVDGSPMVLDMELDITDRRRAEAAVQRLADELRALANELSKTEQRERQRLAQVLHDNIQQLLVAAQMQLSLIKHGNPSVIRSAAQGLDSILSETLEASRSLTVELCPPVLQQSGLASALTWLAARMKEKHQFAVQVRSTTEAEPATPEVRALVFEATREMLLNAVKHSGVRKASVTMSIAEGDCCRIVVEDKGRGFKPASVKPGASGGFGLFSIQQRLLYLGGTLEIESAPGRGTRAVMTIPIGRPAAPEFVPVAASSRDAVPRAESRFKNQRTRILLADDHKIMRQGLSSLLQFESDIDIVAEAEDGLQALRLAREHRPDVVIMDIGMPVMNGIEATKMLATEMPDVKVIGLSMHIDADAANAMREAGAVAYLTKGGPSEHLVEAIRACCPRTKDR